MISKPFISLPSATTISLMLLLFVSCHQNKTEVRPGKKETIKNMFANWKIEQIKNHTYWADDSCSNQWIADNGSFINFNSTEYGPFGFYEDSDAYKFVFADLNEDSIIDGLITFQPKMCEFGTIGKWIYKSVLVSSSDTGYKLNDSIDFSLFKEPRVDSAAFLIIDSIAENKIFITSINYEQIELSAAKVFYKMEFDYKRKKLIQLIDSIAVY